MSKKKKKPKKIVVYDVFDEGDGYLEIITTRKKIKAKKVKK